jgi:8-oxo-dGTP diphosphatase
MTSAFDSAVLRDFHLVAWLVLERPDGSVLLAKRAGVRYGEGLWGLPGGHVENGESLIDAAVRELREEVGVIVQPSHVQPLGVTRYAEGDIWGADFFFLTRHWSGEPQPITQCSEVAWHAPTALPRGTLPWLGRALRSHLLEDRWFDESV